jgi:hypothetical protein
VADPVLLFLQVLHVAVAATAFAITMPSGGALKRASGQSREIKASVATLVNRSGKLASMFGLLTLLSGLGLIFYLGGFKVVAPTIHAGLAIILVMIAHGALFMRPTGARITAAADQDDAAWAAARKRFSIGDGIMQLLWLIVLVLMFIKQV